MADVTKVEGLLQDAIALLDECGFPMAAEALRDHLRGIRTAPTAGARRRRILQLRGVFDGAGPGPDVFHTAVPAGPDRARYGRTKAQRDDEARYRRTLEALQALLAAAPDDESGSTGWSPSIARVA